MIKKIVIGLLLYVAAILLLQIDDDLNPEATAFLERAKPAKQSEAYLYLLGIMAAEDEDPLTVGKQQFALIQQAEESYTFWDENFEYEGYPKEKALRLPEGELFCHSRDEHCWQTIFDNSNGHKEALQTYATLLDRYEAFRLLDDYHTLTKSSMVAPLPPVQYLVQANRLLTLQAITDADKGDLEQAVKRLLDNISALRMQLKNADTLVGEVVFNKMLSNSIDVLSLLIHEYNIPFDDEITPILSAEHDLTTAMSREFAMSSNLFRNLDRNSELFKMEGNSPAWYARIFFKPNMSINEAFLAYENIAARSTLEQTVFADADFENVEMSYFSLAFVRNSAGSILNNIATPQYAQYTASLFDLNAKITLFNQVVGKAQLPVDLDYIQNPYYKTGGTAYYSDDGKSICLTGPLEDEKKRRCLRVKL